MSTKPQLKREDYLLLYIRINKIVDRFNTRMNDMERVFLMEHVKNRFKPDEHIYSRDKDDVSHCYRELKQDSWYFIFAHRVAALTDKKKNGKSFGRWVWRAGLELTESQARAAYEFYEKHPNDAKACGKFVDQLLNPSLTPVIDEFSYPTIGE